MDELKDFITESNSKSKFLEIGLIKPDCLEKPTELAIRFDPAVYRIRSMEDWEKMEVTIGIMTEKLIFPSTQVYLFTKGILDLKISSGYARYTEKKVLNGLKWLVEEYFQNIRVLNA